MFREELELNIQAPREAVWAAFQDFSSWPSWAKAIRKVERLEKGWRFIAHGQPPVELVWAAEATVRQPPEYLAFASLPGEAHNLELHGHIRLSELPDGSTHMEVVVEGKPHYHSRVLDKIADLYAMVFGEPNKLLKVTFEQLKVHLEETHRRQLSAEAT